MKLCYVLSTLIILSIVDLLLGQDANGCVSLTRGDQSFNSDIDYVSMKWFETPSIVSLGRECTGEWALGLENGFVTDQQISASSSWNKNHGPENARLNLVATGGKTGAWSAETNDRNQFLQVDFSRDVKITKFQTQGRQDADQWVKKYTLSYSVDGSSAFQTHQENGVDKVFNGNTDRNSIVTHVLLQPITARYVQIKPTEWHGHVSMRAEFRGCVLSDRYQVIGRNVHMAFVQEHLRTKKSVNFGDSQERPNHIELEILADTVYVKGVIKMRGIKKLTVFSRKVSFLKESQLDLRAPDLLQSFNTLSAGDDGDDGKHGVHGPTVEIFADTAEGYMKILTNGGNGNAGQDGANGKKGADSLHKRADKTEADCRAKAKRNYWGSINGCTNPIHGTRGVQGGAGGHGGYAGKSGNGGEAGHQTVHARRVQGKMELKTCRGVGGQVAKNGLGGAGGHGGRGGRGIYCKFHERCGFLSCSASCYGNGQTSEAARGPTGPRGTDGQTLVSAGSLGRVQTSYLQKQELSRSAKDKYPLTLLKLMTRHAEDLIWANNIVKAEAVLNFVVTLTVGRTDASELRKIAKRRLAFLNKEGYDRFGNNELFAPLMKWETYKEQVEDIRDHARAYEDAYNGIQASIERQDTLKEVLETLPEAAKIQVDNERTRLIEARRVAISEKGAYVASIKELEASMKSSLEEVIAQLPDVYEASQFNRADLFAILQGITGFASGIVGKDPAASIGAAIEVAGHFATKCNTGTLQDNLDKIEKWMTFGEAYAALEDSSDLDFDQMHVGAVPEVMMANLEMNKEGLAADLVCMLDERSLPRDKAKFEEQIARFFIAGAARIDLIAKVIDLDNDIGGYNFDISNLEETSNNIQSLMETGDSPIADSIQQTFLDDLLTSYGQMETSFTEHLYHFYKGFEFRSLWNVNNTLIQFERTATEVAAGTGSLQGVLQLTNALQEIDNLENKGRQCFTTFRYTTNTHKWSFDSVTHPAMFDQLHNGSTRLTLQVSDSCDTCYNVRLLKMYVELYGDGTQNDNNYPAKVHLKLRHMSGSYFRAGNGNVKEFRQPLGSWRKFEFNRFAITNIAKCNEEKKNGNSDSLFCMEEDDYRFQPMCCHYLSNSPCNDILLGAEECTSPFGTYEISMPVDENTPCQTISSQITDKNCKDFDRTSYTKMNIWIHYLYWTGSYPTGPDDTRCTQHQKRKSDSRILLSKLALSLTPEM